MSQTQTRQRRRTQRTEPKTETKSGFASRIQTSVSARPKALMFYGPPGVGKTETLGHAPGALFVVPPEERGIVDLKALGKVPESTGVLEVKDWDDTLTSLREFEKDNHGYNFLVFDSMTWYQTFCWAACCRDNFNNNWSDEGFFSYYKGPTTAAERYWPAFVEALDRVRDGSGMDIVCLAHSRMKKEPNPEGPDYDKHTPNLDDRTYQKLHIWAQGIYFMNYYTSVEKDGMKYKAVADSESRYIYTKHSPIWDAKDRFGLPALINMGNSGKQAWENFSTELEKATNVN